MKKKLSLFSNLVSAAIFLQVIDVGDTVVRFVLVGEIPGTDVLISPVDMIVLWSLIVAACLVSLVPNIRKIVVARSTAQWRRHLPRRRFTQI